MLPDINIPIKEKIIDSAISVIATFGMHRMTHRKIAQRANISLSSTTYHYESKDDIFRDAISRVLYTYLGLFKKTVETAREDTSSSVDLIVLLIELISNAAERERNLDLAWCEIMLASARTDEGRKLALAWFDEMDKAWVELAKVSDLSSNVSATQCLLDVTCGLVFMTLSLGLDRKQVLDVIKGADPLIVWNLTRNLTAVPTRPEPKQNTRRNGAMTHEKLVDTAVEILLGGGAGSLTYQAVAERGGFALTAPSYHFGKLSNLVSAAEARLLDLSKSRYREGLRLYGAKTPSRSDLVDTTAAILIREATEFSSATTAHYTIWMEAARAPGLRPKIKETIRDQTQAWQKQLSRINPTNINIALVCEAFCIGWLIRATSTGAPLDTLAAARQRFKLIVEVMAKSQTIEEFFRNILSKSA